MEENDIKIRVIGLAWLRFRRYYKQSSSPSLSSGSFFYCMTFYIVLSLVVAALLVTTAIVCILTIRAPTIDSCNCEPGECYQKLNSKTGSECQPSNCRYSDSTCHFSSESEPKSIDWQADAPKACEKSQYFALCVLISECSKRCCVHKYYSGEVICKKNPIFIATTSPND